MKYKKSLGLAREAFRTKWGQNFLRDPKILKKIANFARIKPRDILVEIGPGEGRLTKILLERARKVIAIEKDHDLASALREKFVNEIEKGKLEVVAGDVLNYELRATNYLLVGNIPYYITGALFKKFLSNNHQPRSITFVIQKEVAERILAKDGKESILSVSVKAYGQPVYGGLIKAGSFSPRPKVDSAIISIRDISKEKFVETTPSKSLELLTETRSAQVRGAFRGSTPNNNLLRLEQKFFEILKKGFAHKRKLLINNLEEQPEKFTQCGLSQKARAENLSVDDWLCLSKLCIIKK